MIIVLKRFDINYETMTKFKINSFCEFPMNLDLKPYANSKNQS